ncbi:MAG: CPBP family intramembrane metalloprotease [Sphingobacteriaceae bacterium]|nr:CPBP family intramembrane metalloprotease [Sphingobacteriaceae bacterium]
MQAIKPLREENSPYLQLLFLMLYALIGVFVFAIIGFISAIAMYGPNLITNTAWLSGSDSRLVPALKIILTAQQFGLFLTPAILLAITEGKKPNRFYGMSMPKANSLLIVILIMAASTPAMGFINELNQQMHLPSFLKGVENWMRKMEDEGMVTTMAILKMNSISGFLINLTVIAVIPAICEEFIFRGGLQRTFLRIFKNPHVAIWTSAIIFSAIHFQFFGFFPRLFLGAAFGYIYFWTGSIWHAVLAHFLNNGFAVTMAFYFQKNNLPINQDENMAVSWYVYLISAILTIALFRILKDKTTKEKVIE